MVIIFLSPRERVALRRPNSSARPRLTVLRVLATKQASLVKGKKKRFTNTSFTRRNPFSLGLPSQRLNRRPPNHRTARISHSRHQEIHHRHDFHAQNSNQEVEHPEEHHLQASKIQPGGGEPGGTSSSGCDGGNGSGAPMYEPR